MKGTVVVSIQINKINIQLLYHEPALSKCKSINWYNQGWNNNKCSYQIWFDIRDVCYKINLVDESIPLWLCKKVIESITAKCIVCAQFGYFLEPRLYKSLKCLIIYPPNGSLHFFQATGPWLTSIAPSPNWLSLCALCLPYLWINVLLSSL